MLEPSAATSPSSSLDAGEADLLARVASGDAGVPLRALYRRYEGRLYGLGLRLLGDPGLAEELMQETFVRVWQVLLSITVRDAMMSLTPAHREVLELVYDDDLRLADVAARLDVPLGTVKTRAFHALRAMGTALAERGWHD